ncbi:MAG TPA: hypothetical protein VK166_18195 [Chitinophagaceae bacterium]|nr:hypothetical protein [Chitinophagaceae bacterium]
MPKGVWAFNTGWPGMNQNINPTGTILVHKAEVKVNVFPITTLYRTFSLANRFAPLSLMVNPDTLSGSALDVPPVIPLPTTSVTANGWSDGFVAFKLGLAGATAQPGV